MSKINTWARRLLSGAAIVGSSLLAPGVQAAAPGITGPSFELSAAPGYISQPDGSSVYVWGYGCESQPTGSAPSTIPLPVTGCPTMQLPGPTLIVNEGDTVAVTLHNHLPLAAGNTSMLFPGFAVCAATLNTDGSCTGTASGMPGVLTQEAAAGGGTVTYTFIASKPGTHAYYSGTQADLQIEMGLYGALIVLPASGDAVPAGYTTPARSPATCVARSSGTLPVLPNGHPDYRLAAAAYDHPSACYEREYLFQFSTIDPGIHQQADQQSRADAAKPATGQCARPSGCLTIATEPYVPAYFMVNGRSMPDLMEPNYASEFPHQPYNGNPHMHPGELVLLRIVGTNRWQHPFHEHGNHVRILARDGNLLLVPNLVGTETTHRLAGPLLFTTTTTPGLAMDGIYQWTAKGLNWDVYGHTLAANSGDGNAHTEPCVADANGFYTTGSGALATASNYYEWCGDHLKPLEHKPFGAVGGGGPVTLPDANLFANGPWYGGSPYLGPEATQRAVGSTPIPPSGTVGNSPTEEAGFAFMWHSHNEREITTNNAFPGGMMMMMLVDPWVYNINEAK